MRPVLRPAPLLATLALAACTVGPNYKTPDLHAQAGWSEKAGGQPGATLSTVTAGTEPLDRWWTQFKDPVLDDLVRRALRDNLTLAQARARVVQAREQVIVVRAAGLPQVSGTADAVRLDTQSQQNLGALLGGAGGDATGGGTTGSATGATAAAGGSTTKGFNRAEVFELGLNASWELDLFGAVRRQTEAARAQAEQQEWSARDTEVSLVSQLADAYLQMRLSQARAAVLRKDLQRQQDLFTIIGQRFKAGFVTNLDVSNQRVQLVATQAQIPQVDAQAEAQAHAIAILLGLTPDALYAELAPVKSLPPVPPQVPAGLPSDLLRRRPDIRAQERALAAANAQIGAAVAAQFPTFNLNLLPTYSRISVSDMFQPASRSLLSLGQGALPLFEGGRLRAGVRQARAAYDQAFAGYKQTALQAFQEVEDAIVNYQADQRRWTSLTGGYAAAQRADLISRQQYGVGLTDYTSVLNTDQSLYSIEDQLTQVDGALATDVVALYKALGGGWDDAATSPTSIAPGGAQAAAGR